MSIQFALSIKSDMLWAMRFKSIDTYIHLNKNWLIVLSCILLIVSMINPSFAQTGEPSKRRWVIGAGVNLREQANLNAPVLARMALNTPGNLMAAISNSKYCEIELIANGQPAQRGFTACEFLGTSVIKPREIANAYLDDGKIPNPNYNPERAFWLKPSYEALAEYGRHLENKRNSPKDDAEGVFLSERPKIPEFERMKEHLAKGILVAEPEPYLRWKDLKTSAHSVEGNRRLKKLAETQYQLNTLNTSLIYAIELPAISNSYFQKQNEIAAPTKFTEKVSAQFQIIQTIHTKNYESLPKGKRESWFGLWDISEVNRSLTQSVIKNTLSIAGGDVQSEAIHLRQKDTEYGLDDGVMCEGYEGDGFKFGDADPKISINYAKNGGHPEYAQPKKAGRKLMYFFTKQPLPQQTATVNVVKQKLNRAKTGFIAATEFHFDINSDGIPDFIVWEGSGVGPSHLDGPTKTDDAWYRIFFVNIAGHWHLLGADTYSYGCGC